MNINITKSEFEAVSSAIDFIETGLEAADQKVADAHADLIRDLYSICEKFKKAREKEAAIRVAEKVVRKESKRQLTRNEIRKFARKIVKNVKNETE